MATKSSPFFTYQYPPSHSFPHLQPPSYSETILGRKSPQSLKSTRPHPLDTTPPNLLLTRTLNPVFKLSKWIGIFPLEIDQDGWASCGVRKFASLLYLVWLLIFVGLSAYYSPLYLQLMNSERDPAKKLSRPESIHTIAKYLFVSGQFLAAAATLLVVPRLAWRTVALYNRLNAIITTLGERGVGGSEGEGINANFRRIYKTSRLAVVIWFLVVCSSLYLWWKSFHKYFRSEFGSRSVWEYYPVVGGALSLAVVIAAHVLPSFVFIAFADVMRATYRTIRKVKLAKKMMRAHHNPYDQPRSSNFMTMSTSSSTSTIKSSRDLNQLSVMLDLFARLNTQVNRLGEVFGRHLIIEMSAFFTAILTNCFTFLTGFDHGQDVDWETTFISIFINLLWFGVICEAGEAVGSEQHRCLTALKTWIVGAGLGGGGGGTNSVEGTWLITTLLDDEVRGVTAANYFRIKRSLSTQVIGALVMYLIVMLQFKSTG